MADALVIGLAKKVKRGGKSASEEETDADEGDEKEMSLDEAEDSAIDDLAEAFGVEDVDQDAAKTALRDFVKACVKRLEKGDY